MKESEAKKKWCPMVRFTDSADDSPANRWHMSDGGNEQFGTPSNPKACRCIGSDCMLWVSGRPYTDGDCGLKR